MQRLVPVLVVLCILTGCSNSTSITLNSTESTGQNTTQGVITDTSSTEPLCYLIYENAENVISFPIPRRNGMSAEEMTYIQTYIQNELLVMTGERILLTLSSENIKNKDQAYTQYMQYSILMESQITYESDTYVGVVWRGLLNKSSTAHPTHWLFALNYNPQTLQTILLSEEYLVDNQLYAVFADLAAKALEEECRGILPTGWESFGEPIPSEREFIEGLDEGNGFSYYLQDTGVTIVYPVPFALGNHKEVIIPYDKLTEQ